MDGLKLSALLPDNLERASKEAILDLQSRENVGCLKVAWNLVDGQLQKALQGALDYDVLELVGEAWAKARLLSEFADPKKHPPGERSVVPIGGREFSREVYPTLSVQVGSCPCVDLKFTFAVSAHLGGVELIVSDAHIRGGNLGEAWVSAQLSYNKIPLHDQAESKKIRLDGDFNFPGDGIEIPKLN